MTHKLIPPLLILAACGSDTTIVEGTPCTTTELEECVVIDCPGSDLVQVCNGTSGGPQGPQGEPGEDGAGCRVEAVDSASARIVCDNGTDTIITAPGRPALSYLLVVPNNGDEFIQSSTGGLVRLEAHISRGYYGISTTFINEETGEGAGCSEFAEDDQQSIYTCMMTVPQGASPGEWSLTEFFIWTAPDWGTALSPTELEQVYPGVHGFVVMEETS